MAAPVESLFNSFVSETLMKRCLTALLLVVLMAGGVAAQTRGGWLRGEWAGTGGRSRGTSLFGSRGSA